jgi:hypothetical protein
MSNYWQESRLSGYRPGAVSQLLTVISLTFGFSLFATQLLQLFIGVPAEWFRAAPYLATGVALVLSTLSGIKPTSGMKKYPMLLISLLAGSLILTVFTRGFMITLLGLLLYSIGIVGFQVGNRLSNSWQNRTLFLMALVVLANLLAQIWQLVNGLDFLLSIGIQYGQNLRQIDGLLRAPGLTLTNSEIGLFAAVTAAGLTVLALTEKNTSKRLFLFLGASFGLTSLILSTSRSGLLLLLGTFIHYIFTSRRMFIGTGLRWAVLSLGIFGVVLFQMYGSASTVSFQDRLAVWANLISFDANLLIGHGLGYVGSVSFSSFNSSPGLFTDNMWFSIMLQAGLLVTISLATITLRFIFGRTAGKVFNSRRSIVFGVLMSSFFVEVLDYPLTILSLGFLLAVLRRQEADNGADS